jgi:spore maturation protein CgeB
VDQKPERLLFVAVPHPSHVGGALKRAAVELKLEVALLNMEEASQAPRLWRQFNWHLRERRPSKLRQFSRKVVEQVKTFAPRWVLSTGLAPLTGAAVQAIRQHGALIANYSTDDPWSQAQGGEWFRESLPYYDAIYSTRSSNLADFQRIGCASVEFLPFAYDPLVHFPEGPSTEIPSALCDVVFVGGADKDRLPYMEALVRAGLNLHLWGGYWQSNALFRECAFGHADGATTRRAVGGAKICLCLVRRANRDGHAMRSFEIPAMGGCMLAEDTEEHREIFGAEGVAVIYFNSIPQMVEKARWLLAHAEERKRLASAAHALITGGKNTYADRLKTILQRTEEIAGSYPAAGEPGGVGNHHEA